jgi:multidrug efflux pump subunit AcrA (membrane-fusion protein)
MEGTRVDQLLVKQGDNLKNGQIIAILDNHERLQAALTQAEAQRKISEARLAQVKAGAKQGMWPHKMPVSKKHERNYGDRLLPNRRPLPV